MDDHYYTFRFAITHKNVTKVLRFKLLVLQDTEEHAERYSKARSSEEPEESVKLMCFLGQYLNKYPQEESETKLIDLSFSEHPASVLMIDPNRFSVSCVMSWGADAADPNNVQICVRSTIDVDFYRKDKRLIDKLFDSFTIKDVAKIIKKLKTTI